MTLSFTPKEIFSAYKKVKHYFYYDNTSLFIRQRIAEFEDGIQVLEGETYMTAFWRKMEEIARDINVKSLRSWTKYFQSSIRVKTTPKSFVRKGSKILTNRTEVSGLKLERANFFIDASVEAHIISVLWLKYVGKAISDLIDKDNYAYKLELTDSDESRLVGGLRVYKPYFVQYQNWRDNAIEKAEQLLEEEKDFVILSLDIKDYFNAVRIDLDKVKEHLFAISKGALTGPHADRLFELLGIIHNVYSSKISVLKGTIVLEENESILPIGLLSSGVLGNYYLRTFDADIKEALNPSYYGRYVDDILLVLTNLKVDHNAISPVNDFLSKYLVERKILDYDNIDELPEYLVEKRALPRSGRVVKKYRETKRQKESAEMLEQKMKEADKLRFHINKLTNLKIQGNKVVLQNFDYKESPAIINKFKKNIEKNRSEFRYLPDEDKVDTEFDEEAFSLHYNDSVNKIRSIKEFSEDKYGASKYLAGKIFATSLSNEGADENTTKQILTFFKGTIALSFHTLWEKVATYFVINNEPKALASFYNQVLNSIKNITFDQYEDEKKKVRIEKQLKADIVEYLKVAIATPLAFNLKFAEELTNYRFESAHLSDIINIAGKARDSNMFRHAWVGLPGINFTKYLNANQSGNNLLCITDDDLKSNTSSEVQDDQGKSAPKLQLLNNLEVDDKLKFLSPRYVHFHELNILFIYKAVHSIKDLSPESVKEFDDILTNAFKAYWLINQEWKYYGSDPAEFESLIVEARKSYFEIHPSGDKTVKNDDIIDGGCYVRVHSDRRYSSGSKNINKKVALANIKVNVDNVKSSYLGKPNIGRDRRQELFKLINLVEKERCDLLVLPEVSVPYQWISLLAYQSSRRNIGIVAGLEHWVNQKKFAFNFIVSVLPIRKNDYSTCIIRIRLKNHYSHEEKRQLKGYRLLIPGETVPKLPKKYDLFHWNNTYFSVYNCFELADINDRALFKSKVDFIVASEYNRDTIYFSEIGMSWVRDLHCFFIQVNSSDYGDSKVVQPAPSVLRSILHIKGGDNSTIVVGRLPIYELRNFQDKEYELQKDDGTFKPTPPDFNREFLKKRMKNLPFHK